MVRKHEKEVGSQEDVVEDILAIEIADDGIDEEALGTGAHNEGAYAAGSDEYVVPIASNPVETPIDAHMRERLDRSASNDRGALYKLKEIEKNLREFLSSQTDSTILETDIDVFKSTLTHDLDLQEFTAFMTQNEPLQRYRTQIEQAHQSPLARAIVIALGIPINLLPGIVLAGIFYFINTIICNIFNDNDSVGETDNFRLRAISDYSNTTNSTSTASQEECALLVDIPVYITLVVAFALINCNRSFNRVIPGSGESPRFFPPEYEHPVAAILRVLLLMVPFIDAIKTDSLTNRISSSFPSLLNAGQKNPFNGFYQRISAYAAISFLPIDPQEEMSSSVLLQRIEQLIQFYDAIIQNEAGTHYQLYQQIQTLQLKREGLEKDILRLKANLERNVQTISEDYQQLRGLNSDFASDKWRERFPLDRKKAIDEEQVFHFIDRQCGKYVTVDRLVDELQQQRKECQQQLNELRTEFGQIQSELAHLKANKHAIQCIAIINERTPLTSRANGSSSSSAASSSSSPPVLVRERELHINMDEGDKQRSTDLIRCSGSPIHTKGEKEREKERDNSSSFQLR